MSEIPQTSLPQETESSVASDGTLEYLLVSDKSSKVLLSSTDYPEVLRTAKLIRAADGEVTIFRALKA